MTRHSIPERVELVPKSGAGAGRPAPLGNRMQLEAWFLVIFLTLWTPFAILLYWWLG